MDDERVREVMGDDVVEDYSIRQMRENATRTWRMFRHGHLIDVAVKFD